MAPTAFAVGGEGGERGEPMRALLLVFLHCVLHTMLLLNWGRSVVRPAFFIVAGLGPAEAKRSFAYFR
jgi:hypothetical protein